MKPRDIERVRKFFKAAQTVLQNIPLPVPPRAPDGWFGSYLEVREMYDTYNRLPAYLQDAGSRGFQLSVQALETQTCSANVALSALYVLCLDLQEKTNIPPEELILWTTPADRLRINPRLTLVKGPEEDDDPEGREIERLNMEVEELLWNQLKAKRLSRGMDIWDDADQRDNDHGNGDTDTSSATALAVADETGQPFWRLSSRRTTALITAAVVALTIVVWQWAHRPPHGRSTANPSSDSMNHLAASELATSESASESASESEEHHIDTPDREVVSFNVYDASQSLDFSDLSVTFARLPEDGTDESGGEDQVRIEVVNNGVDEREMQFNVSAGGQEPTTEQTTIQPGQSVRRVIKVRQDDATNISRPWRKFKHRSPVLKPNVH